MEGVVKQWKEEEAAEVEEEISIVKRQAYHYMHVTNTTITTSKLEVQATEQTNGSYGLKQEQEIIQTEVNSGDIEKKTNLHPLDLVIHVDSSLFSSVRTESERVGVITENVQQQKELYLDGLYQKTPTQGFYCPNCRTYIQKVLLLEETSAPTPPPPRPDTFRCSSCFGFLIPIEVQRRPAHSKGKLSHKRTKHKTPQVTVEASECVKNNGADKSSSEEDDKTSEKPEQPPQLEEVIVQEGSTEVQRRPGHSKGKLSDKRTKHKTPQVEVEASEHVKNNGADKSSSEEDDKTIAADCLSYDSSSSSCEKSDFFSRQELVICTSTLATAAPIQPDVDWEYESSTTWEILKSIVYGGLVESIASLGIVTSSASSDATTLNILALSLANLIGGLFIIVHNMWDLKSGQPRTNNETNARVDRYYQVLGRRAQFYLHVFIAILSFIIFGLVPPLLYAFTFTESNNKDLKLAAVALASAICITLLSISKAYIQRPNKYVKTVLHYLSTGAMTSVVSYLAGELVKELIEKLGWFDTKSSSFTLLLPEMSVEKPRFGSY